jgi:hypothetical protein
MLRQPKADDPRVEHPGSRGEQEEQLSDEGSTRRLRRLIEYALLAALIAVVSVVAMSLSGKTSTKHFCATYSQIDGPPPGARVDSCGHWFMR